MADKTVKLYYPGGGSIEYREGFISYHDKKKKVVSIDLLQSGDVQIKFDDGLEKIYCNMPAEIHIE